MEQRMIINALHPEECRIAMVEGNNLSELEVESNIGKKLKGNIYKAKIARVEPSLQAAFIDIGAERNGFLQINDLHPAYFKNGSIPAGKQVRIQDVLSPGQDLIVQVVKEEREMKGATLTTYLSLPGRYVVVMPGSDRGGISRRINDSESRRRLKALSQELEIPAGMGLIVRTAGMNRSLSELSRDLSMQLRLWQEVLAAAQTKETPTLLYKESDLARRVIRDYFTPETREIVIDDPATFTKVREFIDQVMPRYRSRIKLYDKPQPIFSFFQIEEQVGSMSAHEVKLPSGGALVIDTLEALVAIDVNSGKATTGNSIEDTAFKTNLEAADEVARQLRLRDLGGLVVIDFIDMVDRRHRAEVERRLKEAVRSDKARVEVGKLSKFGLLEMSRQRLRGSLASQSHLPCAACSGKGKVKSPELVALEVLRKIQNGVLLGQVTVVKARLSPAPALLLLNNKRKEIASLEQSNAAQIYIIADGRLRPDEYELELSGPRGAVQATPPPPPPPPPVEEEADDEPAVLEVEETGGITSIEKHRPRLRRVRPRGKRQTTKDSAPASS